MGSGVRHPVGAELCGFKVLLHKALRLLGFDGFSFKGVWCSLGLL